MRHRFVGPVLQSIVVATLTASTGVTLAAPTGLAFLETFDADPTDLNPLLKGVDRAIDFEVSSIAGVFVYALNRAAGVTTLARNPGTGSLSFLENEVHLDLDDPTAMALSPDGKHIYVSNDGPTTFAGSSSRIVSFTVDPGGNSVTYLATRTRTLTEPFSGPTDVTVSPDGFNVYVAAPDDDNLTTFSRDPLTGALTFVGTNGAPGPFAPIEVVVAPDGDHVYATDIGDELIHIFSRAPLTGVLTWVSSEPTLADPTAIAFSPNPLDDDVYVGVVNDFGVRHYTRNALTGALTLVEIVGTPSFRGAEGLRVSDDGTLLVATTSRRDFVALFSRDTGTGALAFLGLESQSNPTVGYISPDNAFVYASGTGRPISIYRPTTFACAPAPLVGCRTPTLPRKSVLKVKHDPVGSNQVLVWAWTKGQATALADFGDVLVNADANDMALCVYDASASPQPLLTLDLPSGGTCFNSDPCWTTNNAGNRVKYKDLTYRPDGVFVGVFRSGAAGVPFAKVKAKTSFLPDMTPPLTTPVRVQLQTASADCFEGTFSTASRNDGVVFSAKSD